MTLAEIIERVRERLDETLGSDSQRFTTADLTQYALDCARWFIARTGCQYATKAYTQTAYQLLEDLPCDCIQVERVSWSSGGDYYPLEATQTRSLDACDYRWQHSTDTRARAYFLLGLDRIALWPEATENGEDYVVHYQQDVHDSLAAVPVEFHDAVVEGAIGRAKLACQKAEGAAEYNTYRAAIAQYAKRRSSVDRQWSMGRGW